MLTKIPIHTRFRKPIIFHQRFDCHPLPSRYFEFFNLFRTKLLVPTKRNPSVFRLLNPVHLPLRPNLSFKLCNRTKHVEQQPPCGITGINALVYDFKVYTLALERVQSAIPLSL
jgi:hypothetical protein